LGLFFLVSVLKWREGFYVPPSRTAPSITLYSPSDAVTPRHHHHHQQRQDACASATAMTQSHNAIATTAKTPAHRQQ
jgi:hypothetical protein